MAIKRCPYCKAIIEEGLEYCSNCGTQLLFPEDEFVDEDIPGERIEEEDVVEEPEVEKEGESEEELSPEETQTPPEEELTKEKLAAGEPAEEVSPEYAGPPDSEILEEEGAPIEPEEDEEAPIEEISPEEYEEVAEAPLDEIQPEEKPSLPTERAPLETADIGKTTDTTEKEKEAIDRFIESIRQERGGISTKPKGDEDELPPWAAKMKETPPLETPVSEEMEEEEAPLETQEEVIPEETEEPEFEQETIPDDSGVGIPETVDQKDLPFTSKLEPERYEEEESFIIQPPSRFSSWIKSKVFDVLFIGALWLITLWITSRVMEVGLFRLIAASAPLLLGFYGILLVVYFFLFSLFLGETLGDHLFSQER